MTVTYDNWETDIRKLRLDVFDEPFLEFRFGQKAQDPRDGLRLFGPYDADFSSRPRVNYAVIGTNIGISIFNKWAEKMNFPVLTAPKQNFRLWPIFPGFEAAFNQLFPSKPVWTHEIDEEEILLSSRINDPYQRVYEVVEEYLTGILSSQKRDEVVGVIICVVPDEVWENCRVESTVANPVGKKISKKQIQSRKDGQQELFVNFSRDQYHFSLDFRRQLKARAMEQVVPIQIIRQSTLRMSEENTFGQRQLTSLSDRMWNLSTAIYYKCGGKPWKLVTAREGVCYIGLAFRQVPDKKQTACCAAQMFLNTGDGIVFLGDFGPWYSPERKQFHLNKEAAFNLLDGVLKTYQELDGKPLTEVFLHSRSSIYEEEFQGFMDACPSDVNLVGVRVRSDMRNNPRGFRLGTMPVMRGSQLKTSNRTTFLWGSGFSPRLGTYRGWEIPIPLKIDIQHGEATIESVANDILGLTKLNYNACHLGDSQPVTVGFSDAVGEILISNPSIEHRRPNFKYYI